MEKQTIKKSISIHAPREKVWGALFDPQQVASWSAEFAPGSYIEGDWQVGGTVFYKDKEGNGLQAKVLAKVPNELLKVEMETALIHNKLEPENENTKNWRGCTDSYRLSAKDGMTNLTVETQVPASESTDLFSYGWDKALHKIKELTEE